MENAKEEYIKAWDYIEIYHSECGWKKLSQVWRVSRHSENLKLERKEGWSMEKVFRRPNLVSKCYTTNMYLLS